MSSATSAQDIAAIAAFKEQWRAAETNRRGMPVSIQDQRRSFEEFFAAVPIAEGCVVAPIEAPGLRGERIVPSGAVQQCALLYFHGGGFFFGSLNSHRHLVSRLAVASGLTAFSIDYSLAPENPIPAAIDEALAAYRWLLEQGLPASRIVLSGDSAGGNLAAGTALRAIAAGLPRPAGLHLMSAWLDLTQSGASYKAQATHDIMLTHKTMCEVAQIYVGTFDAQHPWASPLNGDLSSLPAVMIQVGTDEILLSESLAFAEKAAIHGVDVRLHVWAEMFHDWPLFHAVLPQGTRAIAEAGIWMKEIVS
jgi:monoterpene epsilon-lactone hydrolase